MPDLSVVIANYNTKVLLKNCLNSIFKSRGNLRIEVIVVDNGSKDGSVEMLDKLKVKSGKLKVIKNRNNLLYSKANNQGLRLAKGKYVLILNSDTLIRKDTLTKMKRFMDEHHNCAIATARQIDQSGKTFKTSHKFPTPLTEIVELPIFKKLFANSKIISSYRYKGWDRKTKRQIDTAPGSFMFARRYVLSSVKFFDENLKLYYSDVDLSKKVKDKGYDIYHLGSVTFDHFKAQTVRKQSTLKIMTQAYNDVVYYYKKHFGLFWAGIILVLSKLNLIYFAFKK